MNVETFHIAALAVVVLGLASLIVTPSACLAMSRLPVGSSVEGPGASGSAACDLPPDIAIEGRQGEAIADGLPPLDKNVTQDYKTATFAMG